MTQTVEKPRVSGPDDTGLGGHWRVIVLNDDHNTFEGVASALSTVLPGVSYDKGMALAEPDPQQRAARSSGQARSELAEHYWEQLGGHGLTLAPLEQG